MVNKREMRQRISRGRREQIERNRLEQMQFLLNDGKGIFDMSLTMDLPVSEIRRLVRKLAKINEMPRTLPQKLKKEAG